MAIGDSTDPDEETKGKTHDTRQRLSTNKMQITSSDNEFERNGTSIVPVNMSKEAMKAELSKVSIPGDLSPKFHPA